MIQLDKIQLDELTNFAEELAERFDYSSEILCETPAQFAVRGGLIDVYPVNGEFPVRIDFFGDEIEDLRRFDPSTQRTIESVDSVTLASAGSAEDREVEGAFFGHLKCPVTWILREPEDLLAEFPLIFHYSEKRKSALSHDYFPQVDLVLPYPNTNFTHIKLLSINL